MMNNVEELTERQKELMTELKKIHFALRNESRAKYRRINPFVENLFSWEEKAEYVGAEESRIFDSATIIGDIKIGKNVWIGPECMMDGTGGLEIGNWVDISTGVKIYTHDSVKRALSSGKYEMEYAPVSIGNNCFIGSEAVILKGVKIGDRCVVAANSLVNKSFPAGTIIGGVPAKVIGVVEIVGDDVRLKFDSEEK
jgi:acetyltransferase-like isoleucine patch superfamily enzyme